MEGVAISEELSQRLERIESLLQAHHESILALSDAPEAIPTEPQQYECVSSFAAITGSSMSSPIKHSVPSIIGTRSGFQELSGILLPPLTIPQRHQTSTNHLLSFTQIKKLIGEYPDNFFFRLETRSLAGDFQNKNRRPKVNPEKLETDPLVESFFSKAHTCHPILNREHFMLVYDKAALSGYQNTVETALCFVVFALGSISGCHNTSWSSSCDIKQAPGLKFLEAALEILIPASAWHCGSDIAFPQGLLFAGLYFSYLAKSLHSWKLVHMASTQIQTVASLGVSESTDPAVIENIRGVSWSCFLIECDRLAEFNLPRSGIELTVNDMPFPTVGNPTDHDQLCYLAEISIRRLLNSVHNALYDKKEDNMSVSRLVSITSELEYQLKLWYDSIPDIIKPPLGTVLIKNDREKILRTRYYATSHIINRPFLLYVVSHPDHQILPQVVEERAELCIEICRTYLCNAGDILQRQSPYTWTLSQSSLGAILVLSMAYSSQRLKHLVTDIRELQRGLIDNVSR